MKSLSKIIQEKLNNNDNCCIFLEKLRLDRNTNIKSKSSFTDEELRKDYTDVESSMTKVEKEVYAKKYGVCSSKFRDIQLEILNLLRQNRQSKKKFEFTDVLDFIRFDIKERDYLDYLDEEPIGFVKKLLEYYELLLSKNNINPKTSSKNLSIAGRYILKKYNQLRSYLVTKGKL